MHARAGVRLIDEQYTKTPFYGWPRMTVYLRRQGHQVNGKRVRRLMQLMGLQAIYPKPKTTIAAPDHRIYPYLLRNLPTLAPAAQAQVLLAATRSGARTLPTSGWLVASCI